MAPDAECIIQDILFEMGATDHLMNYCIITLKTDEHDEGLIYLLYPKIAEAFGSTWERTE